MQMKFALCRFIFNQNNGKICIMQMSRESLHTWRSGKNCIMQMWKFALCKCKCTRHQTYNFRAQETKHTIWRVQTHNLTRILSINHNVDLSDNHELCGYDIAFSPYASQEMYHVCTSHALRIACGNRARQSRWRTLDLCSCVGVENKFNVMQFKLHCAF